MVRGKAGILAGRCEALPPVVHPRRTCVRGMGAVGPAMAPSPTKPAGGPAIY